MTLEEYRRQLGLSQSELARIAGLTAVTVSRAEAGENISGSTARAICQALSKELGRTIQISDVTGWNVKV